MTTARLGCLVDTSILRVLTSLERLTYSLSNLGRLVVFRLHEMIPHHDSIATHLRGQAAARSQA